MSNIKNKKYFNISINIFILLNAFLLLRISSVDGLALDELTISWFTDGSFVDIFRRTIIRGDSYPPFGHVLIWVWKRIPCTLTSTLCLKIPSVVIGLLTYYLISSLYKKRFANNIIFGLFTALYFASYSTMFFLTDLKPHGVIQFLIVFYFYLEDKDNKYRYLPLVVASVMHYVIIFLIIVIAIKEVFIDHREFKIPYFSTRTAKKLLLFGIGPLISFSYFLFSSYFGGSQLQKEGYNPFVSIGKSILYIFGKNLFYLLLIIFILLTIYFLLLNKKNIRVAIKDLFISADVSSILGIYIGFFVLIELTSLIVRPISTARNLVVLSPFIFYITSCFLFELINKIKKTNKSKNYYTGYIVISILLVWGMNIQYMIGSPSRNEENFSIPDNYLDYPVLVETSDLATKVSIQLRYDIKNYDYSKKIYYKNNYFLEKQYPEWVGFNYSFSRYNIAEYIGLEEDIFLHYPHEFSPAYSFYNTQSFLEKQEFICEELVFEELLKQRNAICRKEF